MEPDWYIPEFKGFWPNRRAVLQAGPWRWPSPGTDLRHLELGVEHPPSTMAVAVLTTGRERADMWRFGRGTGPQPAAASRLNSATLNGSALAALSDAADAVALTVPMLHAATLGRTGALTNLAHLDSWSVKGGGVPEESVGGHSFGLGFGLALAAQAIAVDFPSDFIATAGLSRDGKTYPVDLGFKLNLLVTLPRRPRLLVDKSQEEVVRTRLAELGYPDWPVTGVKTLDEALALEWVFGPQYGELAVTQAKDAAARQRLVRRLRHIFRTGITHLSGWHSLGKCAGAALQHWHRELNQGEQAELQYLQAVAYRHAGKAGVAGLPALSSLAHLPAHTLCDVHAHYLQDAGDLRDYATQQDRLAASEKIASHASWSEGAARLTGARGRLLQLYRGHEREALAEHSKAAEYWWDSVQFGEISRPLSALLRLAGAIGASSVLALWQARSAELLDASLLSAGDEAFVRLALGTGLALTGQWGAAALHLTAVANREDHLGASALRWLARGQRLGELADAQEDWPGKLERSRSSHARWFQLLSELDQALDTGRDGQSELATLKSAEVQGFEALTHETPAADQPARVQRFFPY